MIDGNIPRLPPRTPEEGPGISVVMPTFRRARHIGGAIHSLLNQDWKDFELLVRDDGSGDDGTAEAVAAASGGDPRVRYHRNSRRLGMPGNLNGGVMDSRGEFIAVCHDHDIYKPNFLSSMMGALIRNPSANFVHCAIDMIGQDGKFLRSLVGAWPELSPGGVWLRFMLGSLSSPVCALTLVPRRAHEKFGLYDPRYGFVADVEMWMRLCVHADAAYVREPLIQVRERIEDGSIQENSPALSVLIARMQRKYIPLAYGFPERPHKRLSLELRLLRQILMDRAAMMKRAWLRGK